VNYQQRNRNREKRTIFGRTTGLTASRQTDCLTCWSHAALGCFVPYLTFLASLIVRLCSPACRNFPIAVQLHGWMDGKKNSTVRSLACQHSFPLPSPPPPSLSCPVSANCSTSLVTPNESIYDWQSEKAMNEWSRQEPTYRMNE